MSPTYTKPDALPGKAKYPHLFTPILLGGMQLKHRFVMAPMTTNFAYPDGSVSPQLCEYLRLRGDGGFALVVTENIGVHPGGRVMPRMLMAHDDTLVPGLSRLAESVQATGAKVLGQISHCGRQGRSKFTGAQLVAPSPIPCPLNREIPHELTIDEIELLERAYVQAARRLRDAGFDGVEIHGAHGYLISEFLSSYSNKRTDKYGGTLANRLRFLLRIVDGIRDGVSHDLPLTVRISADEFVPDGITLSESVQISKALEQHGASAISVSVGVYESFNTQSMVSGEPEGRWLGLAGRIKSALRIPVLGVGRVKRPRVAEQAIAQGLVDIACLGRAAIADPDIPNKVADGDEHRIRWCLSCNVCLGRSARPETICPVNPGVGRDVEFAQTLSRAISRPQRIAILGSSLSCLTAAWVAASRGHHVSVYEPGGSFGGMQRWRSTVPGQEEYDETIATFAERASEVGVVIRNTLPTNADYDTLWVLRRYQAGNNERDNSHAVLAGDLRVRPGQDVTVFGRDLASAEAALVLAARGARVTLRTPETDIAMDAHPGYRALDARLLQAHHVLVLRWSQTQGSEPDRSLVRGATAGSIIAYGEHDAWEYPYGMFANAAAYLSDAYEPGLMTRGIYEAVALAGA